MKSFIFIIAISFSSGAFASLDFNANVSNSLEEILHLRFSAAEKLISEEKRKHPENKMVLLLENYMDFLKLTIQEEQVAYETLSKGWKNRIAMMEKGEDEASPWYKYAVAEIYLQCAFARLKFEDYTTAAKELHKAYKLLEENEKEFPSFLPGMKSRGLLHCLLGTIPDKYKWLTELVGLEGTVEQGTRELMLVVIKNGQTTQWQWLHEETLFYLSFVRLNLSNDVSSTNLLLEEFTKSPPKTPLLLYAASSLALRSGQSEKAMGWMKNYKNSAGELQFHYLRYLLGLCKLYSGDYSCKDEFEFYLKNFKGRTYIKAALQKLAWTSFLSGDTAKYHFFIGKISGLGTLLVDEDKSAQKEALSGEVQHPLLLRARLEFDGGYYEKSLKTLWLITPSVMLKNERQNFEYIYRLARVYHKLNDNEKALGYYSLVFENTQRKTWYYAANAALNMGIIYEESGAFKDAKKWFEACLALKEHDYKDSIDQKAKAGLSRIKGKT